MDNRVTGFTRLFASVGDPVKHSISPEMHNTIYTAKGLNNLHLPIRVPKGRIGDFIEAFKLNFTGLSVTKPHKQDIIPFLDEIDDDAKLLNAVNCIKIEDGKLTGYNTDGYGFAKSLAINNIDVKGREILLAGVGGAAGVVAVELIKAGAAVTLANRTLKKAFELREFILKSWPDAEINVIPLDEMGSGYYGIINATPVGMHPLEDQCVFSKNNLEGAEFAFDLIYNPSETVFLKMAEECGISKRINGFDMLYYQGTRAQEIWTKTSLDPETDEMIKKECEMYLHQL